MTNTSRILKIRSLTVISSWIIITTVACWLIVKPRFEIDPYSKLAMILAAPIIMSLAITGIAMHLRTTTLKQSLNLSIAVIIYIGLGIVFHALMIGLEFNPDALQSWMTLLGWPFAIAFEISITALITAGIGMILGGIYIQNGPLILTGPVITTLGFFLARLI